MEKSGLDVATLEYIFDFEISNDYYEAFFIIEVFKDACIIGKNKIEKFLKEKNIINGIDYTVIEDIYSNPRNGRYLVAEGKKHVNGKNAEIEYFFNTDNKLHPDVNEDGSVDYKKMNLLQKAEKNQVLARKTPVIEGSKGYTVTGKEIFPKKGKDVNFKIGKNIVVSEDGLEVSSENDGAINFENGKIYIEDILELKDGVGVKTGNIEFHGKVLVQGVVENGYTVIATDDIVVNGVVEGATLISDGSIEITKGIQGNDRAIIECKGSFKTRFVNSSKLTVEGDITLDIIMHSEVMCNGKLTANGKKGTVVGGTYTVKKGIDAKIIGSEMGTATNLKIGIDNQLLLKYKDAGEIVKDYGAEIRELNKDIGTMKKKLEEGNRNNLLVTKYKKSLERMKKIKPEFDQATADVKEIKGLFTDLQGSKIFASEIYQGTKINITNTFYSVKEKITRVVISKEKGEVKIAQR